MKKYIAYYRVSTARQGKSGLGLQAQKNAVEHYVNGNGETIGEFTEV
jgi:DNA invertase Pin-like site-specific DNA recombinase